VYKSRMMRTKGKVLADRFHARILRTPTEIKRVLAYVRANRQIHRARWGERVGGSAPDPYSSAARDHRVVLPDAHSYLLARARAQHEAPS